MLQGGLISTLIAHTTQKETEKYHETNAYTVALYTNHTDAQHTARIVKDVAELITLNKHCQSLSR